MGREGKRQGKEPGDIRVETPCAGAGASRCAEAVRNRSRHFENVRLRANTRTFPQCRLREMPNLSPPPSGALALSVHKIPFLSDHPNDAVAFRGCESRRLS
jgi:hypothetical protein